MLSTLSRGHDSDIGEPGRIERGEDHAVRWLFICVLSVKESSYRCCQSTRYLSNR